MVDAHVNDGNAELRGWLPKQGNSAIAMRQLVHYDLDDSPGPSRHAQTIGPSQPSTKKRKHAHERPHPSQIQHWDDPGNAQDTVVYDEEREHVSYENVGVEVKEGEEEEIEESRELTHEETWDDSALIEAWYSAEAEYEVCSTILASHYAETSYKAYHGKSKGWKKDPVKKSPLYVSSVGCASFHNLRDRWYNVPRPQATITDKGSKIGSSTISVVEDEDNTAPIDFDTFVPMHDPSLPVVSEQPPSTFKQLKEVGSLSLPASTAMVSRDEAFNNALSAMYWTGYWTAVYHVCYPICYQVFPLS